MWENPHVKGSGTHREENLKASTTIHIQGNKTFEDLNYGMEYVFRDYRRFLKQTNDPLPPRYGMMEFDVRTNTKELGKN